MDLLFNVYPGTGDDICIDDVTLDPPEAFIPEGYETYVKYATNYEPFHRNSFMYEDTITINYLKYKGNNGKSLGPFFTLHTCKNEDGEIITTYKDELHIDITQDGYYEIHHFVLPTVDFITDYPSLVNEYNPFYCTDGKNIYKRFNEELTLIDITELINKIAESDMNVIPDSVSYASKTLFLISQLKKCFVNLSQQVFDATINNRCINKNDLLKQLTFKRDFIWMTLNVIEYYVEDGHLSEAQKTLEATTCCGDFCGDNYNLIPNTPNSSCHGCH